MGPFTVLTAILCPFGTCLAVETAKKVPQHEDHENARLLFLGSYCPRWIGLLLEHLAKNHSIALSNQKRLLHALWRVRRRQRRCSVETSSQAGQSFFPYCTCRLTHMRFVVFLNFIAYPIDSESITQKRTMSWGSETKRSLQGH